MEAEVEPATDGWLCGIRRAINGGSYRDRITPVMVVQSWKIRLRRLRGKDISPCRLLFLDEAARGSMRALSPRCLNYANVFADAAHHRCAVDRPGEGHDG